MPFTVAHAAAVLPLVRRAPLVPAALVIGSMAPDLPYFLPVEIARSESHQLTWAFTWTALTGLVLWWTWEVVLAPVARDLAPRWLRVRWVAPTSAGGVRRALWAYLSLVIGILTHLLWDAFTHRTGFAVQAWPSLRTHLGPLALYKVLQFGSGVAGVTVLALWCRRRVRAIAPRSADSLSTQVGRTCAWVTVGLLPQAFAFALSWRWARNFEPGRPPVEDLAFTWVTATIGSAMLVSFVIALVWWAWVGRAERLLVKRDLT